MKSRKCLFCTLAALLLAGCSLARPEEQTPGRDRLVGIYMVYTQGNLDGFYDNPCLEEYGTDAIDPGQFLGAFPQEVLFAVEDEAGGYIFPGMEGGYSLFYLEKYNEFGPTYEMVSNMAPGEEGVHFHVSGEETSTTISGTVYYGPPLKAEDWDQDTNAGIWKCYRVYQTADGRLYLDGSGNSFSGSFGYGENQTQTATGWDGKTVTESIDIYVWVEAVERIERLAVTQFDENNAAVRSDDLALREELPEVHCEAETAWVLVEEIRAGGTVRTAYSVPEEGEFPISHMVVLLDDEGLGYLVYLSISAGP